MVFVAMMRKAKLFRAPLTCEGQKIVLLRASWMAACSGQFWKLHFASMENGKSSTRVSRSKYTLSTSQKV